MLVKSKVKYIQTLGQKKFRDQEKLFIAEGPKLLSELLEADASLVKEIYAVQEWIDNNQQPSRQLSITTVTETELEKISQLVTPNKVMALVQQYPVSDEIEKLIVTKDRVILALDRVQDPGNLGTIIRIADWFGISLIVCSHDSADRYNPKVVQATMGSIARVSVFYTDLAEWLARQTNTGIYATAPQGQDLATVKKIREGIIVIGNESVGIGPEVMQLATVTVSIPKKGKAESLNAAVSAGIILSHMTYS